MCTRELTPTPRPSTAWSVIRVSPPRPHWYATSELTQGRLHFLARTATVGSKSTAHSADTSNIRVSAFGLTSGEYDVSVYSLVIIVVWHSSFSSHLFVCACLCRDYWWCVWWQCRVQDKHCWRLSLGTWASDSYREHSLWRPWRRNRRSLLAHTLPHHPVLLGWGLVDSLKTWSTIM